MKKLYGIIGYPLGQSASPSFFNKKFSDEGIDAHYAPYEISDIKELENILADNPTLCGFNVTIPYKLQIKDYLEGMSDEAAEVGAVNVVKVTHDEEGKAHLHGYNSDVIGFASSLSPLLKEHHKRALILGTGGVSKAVACALHKLGIEYLYVSRKAQKDTITYGELTEDIMASHTLIINCTPLGMVGHGIDKCPDIPYNLITERHILYDVVYNPEETLFLQKGAAMGATTKSGYEMWYLQALASWEIWNS